MLSYPSVYLKRLSGQQSCLHTKTRLSSSVSSTSRRRNKHRKSKHCRHTTPISTPFAITVEKITIDVLHYFDFVRDYDINLPMIHPITEHIINNLSKKDTSTNGISTCSDQKSTMQALNTLQEIRSSMTQGNISPLLDENKKRILGKEIANYIRNVKRLKELVKIIAMLRKLNREIFKLSKYIKDKK